MTQEAATSPAEEHLLVQPNAVKMQLLRQQLMEEESGLLERQVRKKSRTRGHLDGSVQIPAHSQNFDSLQTQQRSYCRGNSMSGLSQSMKTQY